MNNSTDDDGGNHLFYSRHLFRSWGIGLMIVMGLGASPRASGFALWSAGNGYTDVLNNPNDYAKWDQTTIKYKLDYSFTYAFPDTRLHDQIRWAFNTWHRYPATGWGPVYSYNRTPGWQPHGDIRSIAFHEIGHVLGLRHPEDAAAVGRNWRQQSGSYVATADQGNEVMQHILLPGSTNHEFSRDELEGYKYLYGNNAINFVETTQTAEADILIRAYRAAPDNWAYAEFFSDYRDPLNQQQGRRIHSATIDFNVDADPMIGFTVLGLNWDYQNTAGKDTRTIQLTTYGSNIYPLGHNSSGGVVSGNNFTGFGTSRDLLYNDSLVATWHDPALGDIPAGERIHIGLTQDVPDWYVNTAEIGHPDGSTSLASMMSMHIWGERVMGIDPGDGSGGELRQSEPSYNTATGIRIKAPNVASTVSNLKIGVVTGMGLGLDDLNSTKLAELEGIGVVESFPAFDPTPIPPDGEFILVLEGTVADLPPDLQANGNYMLLNRPDLIGQDLFVYVQSDTPESIVGNYALVNQIPITNTRLLGDLDEDGFVGIGDLNIVLSSWNQSVPLGDARADPTGDGFVGIEDLNFVLGNWNTGTPVGNINSPEPSTLAILVPGSLVLLRRRFLA